MEKNSSKKIVGMLMLALSLVIYSLVTVFAKLASGEDFLSFRYLLFYGMEFAALAVYAFFWQQALKHMKLMTAVASKGLVVVIGLLWSVLLFHESLCWTNILGAIVIACGVVVVVSDDK